MIIRAMSQFITRLLIVSLLTLNVAWAADGCAFTFPGDAATASVHVDGDSPVNPSNADFDCDDWCHAWVTVVALLGTIILVSYTPATINGGFYTLSYSSLPIPPLFHPPIA